MEEHYTLHLHDGIKTFSKSELIENAKQQERDGVKPMYVFYGKDTSDHITPPGWLVFSTWTDGAGVVCKYDNGRYGLIRGWQGEFVVV